MYVFLFDSQEAEWEAGSAGSTPGKASAKNWFGWRVGSKGSEGVGNSQRTADDDIR